MPRSGNQPEKKKKKMILDQVVQGFVAHVFIYLTEKDEKNGVKTYTRELRAVRTDSELASIAAKLMGRKKVKEYTEDAVRKVRKKFGITRCTPWGGARPGAGRPEGHRPTQNGDTCPAWLYGIWPGEQKLNRNHEIINIWPRDETTGKPLNLIGWDSRVQGMFTQGKESREKVAAAGRFLGEEQCPRPKLIDDRILADLDLFYKDKFFNYGVYDRKKDRNDAGKIAQESAEGGLSNADKQIRCQAWDATHGGGK